MLSNNRESCPEPDEHYNCTEGNANTQDEVNQRRHILWIVKIGNHPRWGAHGR